jgi:peptide/nickel transport system permease protein
MLTESKRGVRAFQYLFVIVVAISLNFFLPRMMPGNPLALLAGVDVGLMTPEDRAKVMAEAGLDRSLPEQYLRYWGDLLQGDFGYSYRQREPITELIMARLPWTLFLAGASLAVAAVIGIALGAYSAWRRASFQDVGLLWTMITINSLPSFWLGMLLIAVVSVNWGWLPSFGAQTPAGGFEGIDQVVDIAKHAILPVLTLTVLTIPAVYLTMRYTMLSVLGSDFIRTARAKGAGESRVLFGHAMRNSLAPVVTVLALRLGFAFGGTVIVETVYSYPGIGRLMFEAVGGRDFPVMQAGFLLITIAVLLSNLLADFLYPFLDPRVKSQ